MPKYKLTATLKRTGQNPGNQSISVEPYDPDNLTKNAAASFAKKSAKIVESATIAKASAASIFAAEECE